MPACLFSNRRVVRRAVLTVLLLAGAGTGCADRVAPEQQLAQARLARQSGQPKTAIILLKNVLEAQPGNTDARLMLGELYLDSGTPELAEIELQKALAGKGDRKRVYFAWARALLASGAYDKLQALTPAQEPTLADHPDWLAIKAEGLASSGKLAQARAAYSSIIGRQADHLPALLGLAKLAIVAREFEVASAQLDELLKKWPDQPDVLQARAEVLRHQGKAAEAEPYFTRALQADPKRIEVIATLAVMAVERNDPAGCQRLLADIRRVSPGHPLEHYVSAMLANHQKQYDRAWELIQKPLQTHFRHPGVRTLAGVIALQKGMYQQAETLLASVLEGNPHSGRVRLLLASALLGSAQPDRALDVLAPALQAGAPVPELYLLAGEAAMQAQDYRSAASHLARAVELNPRSTPTRTRLAFSRIAAGDVGKGIEELRRMASEDKQGIAAELAIASVLAEKRQFGEAMQALDDAAGKQPQSASLGQMRAAIHLAQGEPAKARSELEQVLTLRPGFLPAINQLAALDARAGQPEQGASRFRSLLRDDPANVRARLLFADYLAHSVGRPAEAIAELDRVRKDKPDHAEAAFLLTRLYIQSGNSKQALAVAQDFASGHGSDPAALDHLGQAQLASGALNQAQATYQQLVQLQPRSALARFRLGHVKSRLGQTDAALTELGQAVTLNPRYTEAYVHMASLLQSGRRYAEMGKLAADLQRRFPDGSTGYVIEGDGHAYEGRFAEAAAAYQKAFALAPSGETAIKRHFALRSAGNTQTADQGLADWLRHHPGDLTVTLYLAETAMQEGNYSKAIPLFEAADKSRPNNPLVLNNLAWAYLQTGRPGALATAEQARKLSGDAPAIVDTLASVLLANGRRQEAIALWQQASVKGGNVPAVIHLHLAQAYVAAGEINKARVALRPLLQLDPSLKEWQQAKALSDSLQGR